MAEPVLKIEKVAKGFEIRDAQDPPTVYGRYAKKSEADEALEDWNNYYKEES